MYRMPRFYSFPYNYVKEYSLTYITSVLYVLAFIIQAILVSPNSLACSVDPTLYNPHPTNNLLARPAARFLLTTSVWSTVSHSFTIPTSLLITIKIIANQVKSESTQTQLNLWSRYLLPSQSSSQGHTRKLSFNLARAFGCLCKVVIKV